MTREVQRAEFANSQVDCEFFNGDLYAGIIIGAKWADKNPKDGMVSLDKVEKYLRENIILYVWATDLDKREEWFRDFRKVMEE